MPSPAFDSAGHAFYQRLRTAVLDGEFAPGSALLEVALSKRFDVSRTPVREALARLEHDGLIERLPRGYRVCAGTADDILEIYETRIALESQAAANATLRGTELEIARLQYLHHRASAAGTTDEVRQLHSEWHEALWVASHNETIRAVLRRLTAQLRIYDRGSGPRGDAATAHRDHDRIMLMLVARDTEGAQRATAHHLERTRGERISWFAGAGRASRVG